MGQVGSITPFQGLSHYVHVVSQEQGFHSSMDYFGQKSIHLFLLSHFDHLLQVSQIHCLFVTVSLWIKSSAHQQANNLGYP